MHAKIRECDIGRTLLAADMSARKWVVAMAGDRQLGRTVWTQAGCSTMTVFEWEEARPL